MPQAELKDQKSEEVTVFIYLPEEAVDCWCPAKARRIESDIYIILDDAPKDPVWEFGRGDIVRCRHQPLRKGDEPTRNELVAFEKVIPN
jgi:hypothetical protein